MRNTGILFGQVRFDKGIRGTRVLAYSLYRIFRSAGLSNTMIFSAIAEVGNEFEIEATVKLSNPVSMHTLLGLDFEISESRGTAVTLHISREKS